MWMEIMEVMSSVPKLGSLADVSTTASLHRVPSVVL